MTKLAKTLSPCFPSFKDFVFDNNNNMEEKHHHHHQHRHKFSAASVVEDSCPPICCNFTMNQTTSTPPPQLSQYGHHPHHHQQPPPYILQQLQTLQTTTHEYFQYPPHHHQFQALLQPLPPPPRRLHESVVGAGAGDNIAASVPRFSLYFKPDLNENVSKNGGLRGGGGGGGDGGLPRGSGDHFAPDARPSPHSCWQNREDSAVRQPFWRPLCTDPSDEIDKGENGGVKEKVEGEVVRPEMMSESKYYRSSEEESEQMSSLECREARIIIGELEEICRNPSIIQADKIAACVENFASTTAAEEASRDDGGEEDNANAAAGKMKERKKMIDGLSSMAIFFESIVRQLIEHQESLHMKFMEAIEKMDEERKAREEAWRLKELERLEQDAAMRANERALASQREASIVSYLEKITGQTINLPPKTPSTPHTMKLRQGTPTSGPGNELSSTNNDGGGGDMELRLMSKRWPKVEVEVLIQIRSSLETKFQGPGYKGPLWDEVSAQMASMGFQRTPKRCKEKWENINKYFKKSRENSCSKPCRKKVKTCQYFDQLDQLYYKSSGSIPAAAGGVVINGSNSCTSSSEHQAANPGNMNPGKMNGSVNGKLQVVKVGSYITRIDEIEDITTDHFENLEGRVGRDDDG